MRSPRPAALLLLAVLGALTASIASAAVVPAGVQPGGVAEQAAVKAPATPKNSGGSCDVSIPIIGGAISTVTNAACDVGSAVAGGVGSVIKDAGEAVLDGVAGWLIAAATSITKFVAAQMTATTTPALGSAWFASQFAPIAALGAALALLVTLVALGSAALRRSPDALAGTLVAVVRAGFGTGVIVALTMVGLRLADAVSADILAGSTNSFWDTVAAAWGHNGFGGFGSSALAAVIALVEVFGALFVWLELIVRNAVIYIAVLFFPVALAASIWPPLAGWSGRLGRLLLLFVMLKPVTLIVLSLAGNAAASGLSFSAGAGASASVGTILAAVVIFALAAFAPWALMYLLSADAESAWTAGALRAGAGGAVGGSSQGRSVRSGGGLASLSQRSGGNGGSGGGTSGSRGGGSRGGGGSPGSNGAGGGDGPSSGGPSRGGTAAASGGSSGGAATVAGVIGGGNVGAAAGINGDRGSAGRSGAGRAGGGDSGSRRDGGKRETAPRASADQASRNSGSGARGLQVATEGPATAGAARPASASGASSGRPRAVPSSQGAKRTSAERSGDAGPASGGRHPPPTPARAPGGRDGGAG